jgi:hypothetical protein
MQRVRNEPANEGEGNDCQPQVTEENNVQEQQAVSQRPDDNFIPEKPNQLHTLALLLILDLSAYRPEFSQ